MRKMSLVMCGIGVSLIVALMTGVALDRTEAAEQAPAQKKPKPAPSSKGEAAKKQAPKGGSPKGGGITASGAKNVEKAEVCFGEVPKIEKVTPDEGKAGDKVTITGKNFGAKGCLRGVSFGPGHAAQFEQMSDTLITTSVPSGGRKGLAILNVTTASGEDSKPFLVK